MTFRVFGSVCLVLLATTRLGLAQVGVDLVALGVEGLDEEPLLGQRRLVEAFQAEGADF